MGQGGSPPRLVALDLLRGLTVMGMILVNMPGDAKQVYPLLDHAEWNGFTFADLVFPLFLFMVGVSATLSVSAKQARGVGNWHILREAVQRTLILIALGIAINLIFKPTLMIEKVRFAGVLQRIGLVYFACIIALLVMRVRWIMMLGTLILIGYTLLMLQAPLLPDVNMAHRIDQIIMPGRLLHKTWDPEGLFTTLPAIVSGLIGVGAGRLLQLWRARPAPGRLPQAIWLSGLIMAGLAIPLAGIVPLNKNLWSSSYVLLTGGIGCLLLYGLLWLTRKEGASRWMTVPVAFGRNAIAAYLFHTLLIAMFIRERYTGGHVGKWLFAAVSQITPDAPSASLLCAFVYLALCTLPMLWMARRGWVWKL